MATVHIPPQLRDATKGAASVETGGATLGEVVRELDQRFPGLAARVVQDGRVMPGLAFSVDHVLVSSGLHAPVEVTSVIHIVPGLAGG